MNDHPRNAIASPLMLKVLILSLAIGLAGLQAGDNGHIRDEVRILVNDAQGGIALGLGLTGGTYPRPLSETWVVDDAAKRKAPLDSTPEGAAVQFNAFVKAADIEHLRAMCNDDADRSFVATAIEPRIAALAAARSTAELQLYGRIDLNGATLISSGLLIKENQRTIPTMPILAVATPQGYRISFALALDGSLMQMLSLTDAPSAPAKPLELQNLRRVKLTLSNDHSTLVTAGEGAPLTLYHAVTAYPQPIDLAKYEGADPALLFMQTVHAAYRDGAKDIISSTVDQKASLQPSVPDKFAWEKRQKRVVTVLGRQNLPGVTAIFFRNDTSPILRTFWIRTVDGRLSASSTYPALDSAPELGGLYLRPDWMGIIAACLAAP